MKELVQRLIESVREVLAMPDLIIEAKPDRLEPAEVEIVEVVDLFKGMFGFKCPKSLQPGLLLPDMLSVCWRHNESVSGEMQLSNLLTSMYRLLDDSLLNWTLDGHNLAEMRIADAVTDMAGPLHTLFEVTGNEIAEELFLFDSRELHRIELPYPAYLEMAAASRGIVYWQYLFCDRRLTPVMAKILSTELDFLESRFWVPEIADMRQRLHKRSA